jgi:hypothetical protein
VRSTNVYISRVSRGKCFKKDRWVMNPFGDWEDNPVLFCFFFVFFFEEKERERIYSKETERHTKARVVD